MKNKIILILSILSLIFILSCQNSFQEKKPSVENLSPTSFSIVLPEGYAKTDDPDLEEDQIAYYYKDEDSIDFDVYAWEKENYTLKSEAEHFASEYGSTAQEITFNELKGYYYISIEEYDNKDWYVYNYMFEDESYILELCFWTDNSEKEKKDVNEILKTLSK